MVSTVELHGDWLVSVSEFMVSCMIYSTLCTRFLFSCFVCLLLLVNAALFAQVPWVVALNDDKTIIYFDENGKRLMEANLAGVVDAAEYRDIALGDLVRGNGWFELFLLRQDFWVDVYPLPRPGESSIRRAAYYRLRVPGHLEAKGVSVGSVARNSKEELYAVEGFDPRTNSVGYLVRFGAFEGDERSRSQMDSVVLELPGDSGNPRHVALGFNCSKWNLAVLTDSGRLRLGIVGDGGEVEWNPNVFGVPETVTVKRMRFSSDRIYLLDERRRIHQWTVEGDQIAVLVNPVKLNIEGELIGFAPLAR